MITDVTDLETDLASFFWDHLKKDLRIIGKCLPRGENEVLMMLHRVVQHVAGMQPTTGRCTMGVPCRTMDVMYSLVMLILMVMLLFHILYVCECH